jgi:hypothetical protein
VRQERAKIVDTHIVPREIRHLVDIARPPIRDDAAGRGLRGENAGSSPEATKISDAATEFSLSIRAKANALDAWR